MDERVTAYRTHLPRSHMHASATPSGVLWMVAKRRWRLITWFLLRLPRWPVWAFSPRACLHTDLSLLHHAYFQIRLCVGLHQFATAGRWRWIEAKRYRTLGDAVTHVLPTAVCERLEFCPHVRVELCWGTVLTPCVHSYSWWVSGAKLVFESFYRSCF